jgi:hypothetical protein
VRAFLVTTCKRVTFRIEAATAAEAEAIATVAALGLLDAPALRRVTTVSRAVGVESCKEALPDDPASM